MTQEPVSTTTLPGIMNESVDVHQYLRDKEDEAAMEILPALIYFGLLAVIGDVGNAVALVVYYKRFKPSSTRTYILTMSVLDILFSTFSLPGEILDLRFSLTFDQPWLCRVHRFNTVFLTVGSGFILVAVALDRRRKICHPFRQQLSARQVKLTVIGSAALAAAIAVPFSVLNGRHTVDTEMPGVKGAACSVDDLFLDTLFPLIYNLLLGVVFIFCITSMIVSYVQIGRKIVRHKRKSAGLHGTMLATLNLVDRLESGDASADGEPPLSPSSGDNDDVFLRSDSVSTSSGYSKKNSRISKSSGKAKIYTKPAAAVHPPTQEKSFVSSERLASAKAPLLAKKEQNLQTESTHDKTTTENGKYYRTQSQVKRQTDFEMAVETLAQAVSEDILRSSGLLGNRSSSQHAKQSGSVIDGHFELQPPLEKQKFVESTADIPQGEEGPRVKSSPQETPTEIDKTDHRTVSAQGNASQSQEKELIKKHESSGSHFKKSTSSTKSRSDSLSRKTEASAKSESSTQSPSSSKHSVSHFQRFNDFLRGSLSRGGSLKDDNTDNVTSTLRRRHRKQKIPSRTTWMMFILTAIFVISYLPYLTIYSVRAIAKDVETGLSGWRLNLYTIVLRSYFINSVVNPIVYSFCSARFRHQCRHLLARRGTMSISE